MIEPSRSWPLPLLHIVAQSRWCGAIAPTYSSSYSSAVVPLLYNMKFLFLFSRITAVLAVQGKPWLPACHASVLMARTTVGVFFPRRSTPSTTTPKDSHIQVHDFSSAASFPWPVSTRLNSATHNEGAQVLARVWPIILMYERTKFILFDQLEPCFKLQVVVLHVSEKLSLKHLDR